MRYEKGIRFNFSAMSTDSKARVILVLVFLISFGSFFYSEVCDRFFVVLRDSDLSRINKDCLLALIPVFITTLFVLFLVKKIVLKDFRIYLLLALFMSVPFFYFKSTFLLSNAVLDKSDPIIHDLKVDDKFQSGNKVIRNLIRVRSWVAGETDLTIKVSYDFYANINVGDQVELLTKKGAFNIEWIKGLKKLN